MPIYIYMTNYKQLYNAWQSFAKPKRQLLLERVEVPAKLYVGNFLKLTTNAGLMDIIKDEAFKGTRIKGDFIQSKAGEVSLSVNVDASGNAQVVEHEGRHRAYALKLSTMKKSISSIVDDVPKFASKIGLNLSIEEINKEINQLLIYQKSDALTKGVSDMPESESNAAKRKLKAEAKAEAQKQLESMIKSFRFADEQADKTAQIMGIIVVSNKEQVNLQKDIKQFIGQFDKSIVIPQYSVASIRQVAKNLDNPLNITQPITIPGYNVRPEGKFENVGIMPYINNRYNNDSNLRIDGMAKFAELFSKVYKVTDSNGKEYSLAFKEPVDFFNQDDPNPELRGKKYAYTGTNSFNLEPHPYLVYGDSLEAKEKANSLSYTISKK